MKIVAFSRISATVLAFLNAIRIGLGENTTAKSGPIKQVKLQKQTVIKF
jgi:hypothetical protein